MVINIQDVIKGLMEQINVDVKPYPVGRTGEAITVGDASKSSEVQVALLSDLQAGHLTPSFNANVLRKRIYTWASNLVKIANLHRKMYRIDELQIFALGDMVQGELIGQQVGIRELEMTAERQMFSVVIPSLVQSLAWLSRYYRSVCFWGIPGNHGTNSSTVSYSLDNVIYRMLEAKLAKYPNIHFYNTSDFYTVANVGGAKFLLVHGDQIQMYQSVPMYGVITKVLRWHSGGLAHTDFDKVCMGHFHTPTILEINGIEIFMNGSFVTGDSWVQKKLGWEATPGQWTFGVRKGDVTWRYRIWL